MAKEHLNGELAQNGRALALHARGTGIDAPVLQRGLFFYLRGLYQHRLCKYFKLKCYSFGYLPPSLRYGKFFQMRYSDTLAGEQLRGELAQMVERLLRMREVRGSMPRFSTSDYFAACIACINISSTNI